MDAFQSALRFAVVADVSFDNIWCRKMGQFQSALRFAVVADTGFVMGTVFCAAGAFQSALRFAVIADMYALGSAILLLAFQSALRFAVIADPTL